MSTEKDDTHEKKLTLTRRGFLKISIGAGGALILPGWMAKYAHAAIPGGMLDPTLVPKYQTPMLIPPAMPRAGKIKVRGGKNIDYYEIALRKFQQQILPTGFPMTPVWGYGPAAARGGPIIFNAPSLTIEAKYNTPVRVKWINELVDANGNYLPHLLPVDPTLHWANPPGGVDGTDMRPDFTGKTYVPLADFTDSATQYTKYTGPVPMVVHVHGAAGVGDESDGYAEAWYLPAAGNIPAGYATQGRWRDFFNGKAQKKGLPAWGDGFSVQQYPNTQRASTAWYHDHTLGMTRLNVYAGPAGFYIIRGGPEDVVLDGRTAGLPAVLPGPAPAIGDPPGLNYYEIPIAIQDRAFNADGSLFYPDTRAFFENPAQTDLDELGSDPFIPATDISPIWNPEFFGNCMMVNGNTWPFLAVEQRRYRFRLLNGTQSRFLILDFSTIPGVEVWMIGNEGGYLRLPVDMNLANGGRILLGPAERADIIVDFTKVAKGNYELQNVGPDEPYGGGLPGVDFTPADPTTTGQVMQFRVGPALTPDTTTHPMFLQLPVIAAQPVATVTRPLALLEEMSMTFDGAPAETLLGTVAVDADTGVGTWTAQAWEDTVTENPRPGATEIWEFYNATGDAHPMHIHERLFQVVDRQPIVVDETNGTVRVDMNGTPTRPEAWEDGWKDTVIAYPGQVTRVQMTFDAANAGQFVWHCHIVEHEDNEMMRPYRIGDAQADEPQPRPHNMGVM